jgi:CheY-like chemotaxis protein
LARTVLLADDSVTAQNMGRRILMDAGYEVITVNNGSAALKKIHENRPDLIVLDVYMPGYGGLEVCQRLKESDETMKIPVLLSVGKMEPFKPEEARRVRADGHIVKPFEASELLAALARLEDRIVPQTDAQRIRMPKKSQEKDKEKEKKARFWHSEAEEQSAEPKAVLAAESAHSVEAKQAQEPRESAVRNEPDPVASIEETSAIHNQDAGDGAKGVATRRRSIETQEPEETPATLATAWETEPAGAQGVTKSSPDAPHEPTATPIFEASAAERTLSAAPRLESATPPEAPEPSVATAPLVASGPRWVAENVALTAEEASTALETEMRQAQDVLSAATSPFQYQHPDPHASELPAPAENVVLPALPEDKEQEGAAFAAAASTSGGAAAEAVGSTLSESEAEPPVQSEAAAAWENWRQIRESVMSPQATAAIAESVAEIAQASTPVQTSDASSSPAPVETNLASIVDSVLAELRPKLMEEIAKKMAAEKK